jgi:ribonuclease P protein component
VFREGQRSADRYFTVLYCSNGSNEPRLGFAISRQRVRLAVGRNRLRRLVRESFRHIRPELPGVDIVVMARDTAGKATAEELGGSLARHWERLQRAGGNKSNNGSKDGNAKPFPSPRT